VNRKTVVRNAALLPALLLLVGVLVPLAHAAVITTGYLQTGSHVVSVDSVLIMDFGGGIVNYYTAGWGGDSGIVDTFRHEPPMMTLPSLIQVSYVQDATPGLLPIAAPVPDSWYLIPGSATQAQVMFNWKDTTVTAIGDRGQLGQKRSGLTVSPSIVRTDATIRAERVAGTSCAFVIFDAAGNRVRTLKTQASAGAASATWTGEDDLGHRLPEGIYYCRLDDAANPSARKLILSR
jgi:hypothetical protein